ncbi:MAG: hypothetical protein QM725_16640 [Lacibacter sp.]
MKTVFLVFLLSLSLLLSAQTNTAKKNIFIITTDGFRWQEVFSGADPLLLSNPEFTADTSLAKDMYGDTTAELRRKRLLPFFWNVIAKKGQLYGNRNYGSNVNAKNIYKISYPGYDEILSGYTGLHFTANKPVDNPNMNLPEYLNNYSAAYYGKVAAFASWNIIPYIFNRQRNGLTVNGGYSNLPADTGSVNMILNKVQDVITQKAPTRYDLLTYLSAKEYIRANHPKVVFLGFGETDESAHQGRYDAYLHNASMFDKLLGELYYYTQSDPFYKNNTIFLITTDHGRGNKSSTWDTHGFLKKGSGETWLALIGDGIEPTGELQKNLQIYSNQLASTIAVLLGEQFETPHSKGKPVELIIDNSRIK